jgi:hypothetical protein
MDRDFLALLMEYIMSQQQGPAVDSPYGAQGDGGGPSIFGGPPPAFPPPGLMGQPNFGPPPSPPSQSYGPPPVGPVPSPVQGKSASTPPRTGMLPNGRAFPGLGPQRDRAATPPRSGTPSGTPSLPTPGFQGLKPSSPSANRPYSAPADAAKRIQQAASKPPSAPMSPLTKRR